MKEARQLKKVVYGRSDSLTDRRGTARVPLKTATWKIEVPCERQAPRDNVDRVQTSAIDNRGGSVDLEATEEALPSSNAGV